jgi:23S rRNA (cytidine1920-2'-O)/16S rRNA (cytidine1409-2'-O)-methyltransferase
LFDSRERAQEAIDGGRILVSGSPATKAARLVAPGEPIIVIGDGPRFVGRGGEKLDAALERFAIPVAGRTALDAGASTGGFTDCLLQRGAALVIALDVGYGQLHERLRADSRVEVRERTDVRAYRPVAPFSLIVADLSFISLRSVASALVGELAAPGGDVVVLVKPQFEAGRAEASRGKGVIRDPAIWRRVLSEVQDALTATGAAMMGVMVSPLTGADGNVEFLAHLRAHAPGAGVVDPATLDAVVASVAGVV